jgi:hypothetical protein
MAYLLQPFLKRSRGVVAWLGLLIGSLPIGLLAQAGDAILAGFTAQQIGNTIRADFGIIGGASCLGAELQRLNPSNGEYEVVAAIREVCGGTDFTEFYTLVDLAPEQGRTNTYRLFLGGEGATREVDVFFTAIFDQLLLFPNPTAQRLQLRLDALPGTPFRVRFTDLSGALVASADFVGNAYTFDDLGLTAGCYLVHVTSTTNGLSFVRRLVVVDR